MAIKRIDPKATFKVVSTHDDAIDEARSPFVVDENLKKIQLKQIEDNPGLADQGSEPGRVLKYTKSYNLDDLAFKEQVKPTFFVIKNIPVDTLTRLVARHLKVDTVSKSTSIGDMMMLFVEVFKEGCKQIEEEGAVQDVRIDELPLNVVQDVGSIIYNRAQLGADLKKA